MQTVNRCLKNYVSPIIEHPVSQFVFTVLVEVIKVVTVKIFLECAVNYFFKTGLRNYEVRDIIVISPLWEEIVFRGGILGGIYVCQKVFNEFEKGVQIGKTSVRLQFASYLFHTSKEQTAKSDRLIIPVYLPIELELMGQIYVRGIDRITGVIWKGVRGCRKSSSEIGKKALEEQNKRLQQIFRVHLSALIFAAAHLKNYHRNRAEAMTQFIWSYCGGVIYGYLAEKYKSLVPGILAHSMNNSLVVATFIYPKDQEMSILLAVYVNRIATYLLAVTSLDRAVMSVIGQVMPSDFSSSIQEDEVE